MKNTIKERLLKKRAIGKDGCWNFTACRNKCGYGIIRYDGQMRLTHRVSYEVFVKKIPCGMCVCHACDNPKCFNPAHLFIGTHQDNMADCVSKKRNAEQKGELNGNSVLDKYQVMEIFHRCNNGEIKAHIAKEYGVKPGQVSKIFHGREWNHVTGLPKKK